MIPKEGIDRQIFQTAFDILAQSIISPSSEESSEED